jgi:hypothetical protein
MPKNPLTALPDYPKPVRKRLPGAYIGPELGSDTRKSLIKTLTEILHSADDDRVAQFLSVAEEEIASYRKLTVPRVADEEFLPEQLDRLEKAARDFHDAAYAVGAVGSSWIAQTQRIPFADHAVLEDVQFEWTLEAADWAQFTAEAIVRIRSGGWRRRRGPAISALIQRMAAAYADEFGEQPSAAREGYFMQATAAILKAANLPTVGEKAVLRILERTKLQAPRPRRGRKRRSLAK